MAKSKSALEPETDLWEAFSEPGQEISAPFVEGDDILSSLDAEEDVPPTETKTKTPKAPRPPKPPKVAPVALVAKAPPTEWSPDAIPKGILEEDQALYKAMPYYDVGRSEIYIFKALYKRDPTLEEFDKMLATFNKWQTFDWCISSYTGGNLCPTLVYGKEKTEAPKRFSLQWRRLDKRFWKKE